MDPPGCVGGTPGDRPPCCSYSAWTPAASTECSGTQLTQTRTRLQGSAAECPGPLSRQVNGTKFGCCECSSSGCNRGSMSSWHSQTIDYFGTTYDITTWTCSGGGCSTVPCSLWLQSTPPPPQPPQTNCWWQTGAWSPNPANICPDQPATRSVWSSEADCTPSAAMPATSTPGTKTTGRCATVQPPQDPPPQDPPDNEPPDDDPPPCTSCSNRTVTAGQWSTAQCAAGDSGRVTKTETRTVTCTAGSAGTCPNPSCTTSCAGYPQTERRSVNLDCGAPPQDPPPCTGWTDCPNPVPTPANCTGTPSVTKPTCNPNCTYAAWSPSPATVCRGTSFTQTRSATNTPCEGPSTQSQQATGTKNCPCEPRDCTPNCTLGCYYQTGSEPNCQTHYRENLTPTAGTWSATETCSSWSPCSGGTQTRACDRTCNEGQCGGGCQGNGRRTESRSCTPSGTRYQCGNVFQGGATASCCSTDPLCPHARFPGANGWACAPAGSC